MKVGIIGFGRLGKLIVKNLAQDFELLVYDKINYSDEIKALNATPGTLEDVCKAKVVIPLVPISAFENVIKEIKDLLTAGSLIVDVCSVKIYPIEIMEKYLPEDIQILGTHPMFGPDSAKTTLVDSKIVLCKKRISDDFYDAIKSYLQNLGLKVIEATADRHDREISHSLLLAHFVGRTLIDFKAGQLEIDTAGYRRLLKILGTVENDSWQLFEDMNNYNPHAKTAISGFINAQDSIIQRLKK